ncbi:uncharacterized protein LOC121377465 [Gigantopelta aegis]|uniref:uncharacterized protein LOC121377465 n=1 Tax=Gigantopelta aegis TaxID=1735272 RepID=UPI001B888E11|nr:uncharacterized protein LOC121377465 [Gigantopelta aegis]
MHMLTFVWILLAMLSLITNGRYDSRSGRSRIDLLKAILLEQRKYDRMSKRGRFYPRATFRYKSPWKSTLECCPSVKENIQPLGGLSRNGTLLELYRDPGTVQRFFQTKCLPGVARQPCNFIAPEYNVLSRCTQKYTYTYAIVKDYNVSQPYRMDYIRLKTGCTCELYFRG